MNCDLRYWTASVTQSFDFRVMPSGVVNQRDIFPFESEHGQKTFVDIVDVLSSQ